MDNSVKKGRREYSRQYKKDYKQAQEPFASFPTPPEVKEQIQKEFQTRPANTKASTFRTQKTRRKLHLKQEYCNKVAMSSHRRSLSSPEISSLAREAVSQNRDIRVHQAHERHTRTLERALERTQFSSQRSLQDVLTYESSEAQGERYVQGLTQAFQVGAEHLAAFTRNTPNPRAQFAPLAGNARPREIFDNGDDNNNNQDGDSLLPEELLPATSSHVDSPLRDDTSLSNPFVRQLCSVLGCSMDDKKVLGILWLVNEGPSNEVELRFLKEEDLKDADGLFHGAFKAGFFRRALLTVVDSVRSGQSLEGLTLIPANQVAQGVTTPAATIAEMPTEATRTRTPSPNENIVPREICIPEQSDESTQYGVAKTVYSQDSEDGGMSTLSNDGMFTLLRPIGSHNGPQLGTGDLEPDPFRCNPTVWTSTSEKRVVKVLNNTLFVESMEDGAFVAAWRRVASDETIAEALNDDVVVAMAVRAFDASKALRIASLVEDNIFWPSEKLLQKDILLKVPRPHIACFLGDNDFRRLLNELSDNSLKSLENSVKKVLVARCGDSFDATANKAALNKQVLKSKKKFQLTG